MDDCLLAKKRKKFVLNRASWNILHWRTLLNIGDIDKSFVKDFGLEADRHLLRCLFSTVDFSCSGSKSGDAAANSTPGHSRSNSTSSSASNSNHNSYRSGPLSLQARLLSTELVGLLTKPQLVGNICFAVDNPLPQQRTLTPSTSLVTQIVRTLNCSPIQQAALALALIHSSHPDIVRSAEENARSCIAELIQSYIDQDTNQPTQEGSLNDVSPELLQHPFHRFLRVLHCVVVTVVDLTLVHTPID